MKIYISNFPPKNLHKIFSKHIEKNNNILCEQNNYTNLISKELGIIIIDSKQTSKYLEPNFHPIFEQLTNYEDTNFNLLFDLTNYTYASFISRLPTEYIYMRVIEYSYRISSNKSNLVLKVKYIEEIDDKHIIQLVPIDYYFEYINNKELSVKELLSNIFFKNDFNMFLSMLN